ncbi:carboxypeptidase-like regulatory domain-containing protein [Marinobacter lipolyticus]|uniref:carboxypeptidase-like regulatory domain-containing protein n=1 Tax=Marinobacter lipolyticus TaxID=209639 RepID=UPI003A902D00
MKKGLVCIIILTAALLSGCVPAIKQVWTTQPLSGLIYSAESGEPIPGAKITRVDEPDLVVAITDGNGHFDIEGKAHRTLVLLMAGSGLELVHYIVSAPGFNDALMVSRTLLPAYSAQPNFLETKLYRASSYTPDPECPVRSYVEQLEKEQDSRSRVEEEELYWLPYSLRYVCPRGD